jgi:hypothetical protein
VVGPAIAPFMPQQRLELVVSAGFEHPLSADGLES